MKRQVKRTCRECIYFYDSSHIEHRECRRYPEEFRQHREHWCGMGLFMGPAINPAGSSRLYDHQGNTHGFYHRRLEEECGPETADE